MDTHLTRRHRWRRTGVISSVVAITLLTLSGASAAPDLGASGSAVDRDQVRLLTIGATRTGGMLDGIVADFEDETGYRVTVTAAGPDIFDQARSGDFDIVMAHLGFTELEDFVVHRRGHWPATVFSNTVVFLVPPDDPAGIRDADDPVEAFEAIAETGSPFVVNDLGETLYITDVLFNAAGRPDKGDWFLELGLSGAPAVREAERRGGYTLWGLHPFLMLRQQQPVALDPVVLDDSLMQRVIATVVVSRPLRRVNQEGALALQDYLTEPVTQARIRGFRLPGIDQPVFWPAGNQNDN